MKKPEPPAMRQVMKGADFLCFGSDKVPAASNVVQLKRPGETWATGPMRCLRCKHEAVSVRKLPEEAVKDCPECGCHAFVASGLFSAGKDEAVWLCNCGNTLMELVVSKSGAETLFCIGCGAEKAVSS